MSDVTDAQGHIVNLINTRQFSFEDGMFTWNSIQWPGNIRMVVSLCGTIAVIYINNGSFPPGVSIVPWVDINEIVHYLAVADIQNMTMSYFNFLGLVQANSRTHKANVRALTDVAAILAYDFTTGWPDPTVQY